MRESTGSLSIGLRIFFLVFFFSLFAVMIVSFLSYQSSSELVEEKVAKSSLEAVRQTANQLDLYFQQFSGLALQIRMNRLVMAEADKQLNGKLSFNEITKSKLTGSDLLNSYRDSDRDSIYSIMLIPKKNYRNYADNGGMLLGNIIRSYPGPSVQFNERSAGQFESVIAANGEVVWFPAIKGGFFGYSYMPTMTVGKLLKNLKSPDQEMVLLVEVKASAIYDRISKLELSQAGGVFLADLNHNYAAVQDESKLGQTAPFSPDEPNEPLNDSIQQAFFQHETMGRMLVVREPSELTGWMVTGYFPSSELVGQMQEMLVWTMLAVLFMVIILVLAFFLSARFTRVYRQSTIYYAEIERQNIQLNEMVKLKESFLANTSHELRTPLNGIIGLAESLVEGSTGQLGEKTNYNLTMIISSGRRLLSLVNDILDFSKLKHREIELNMLPVQLYEIVDVVVTMFQPLANQKQIQLTNSVLTTLPPVMADPNRLQQILYNLIGNALKFTTQGSVSISARFIGERTLVLVRDTGCGIPAELHEKIFESFEQADGASTREHGGTGLGLAVTRKLVELHGGDISVTSILGEGSAFTFTLQTSELEPVSLKKSLGMFSIQKTIELENTTAGNPNQETDLAFAFEGSIRVLIVDDEPINLQVLQNHLNGDSFYVYQAASGAEALAWLSANPSPDIILLDVMMPGMSGYEVTHIIRESQSASELPILLLTAKNQVQDLVKGFESGANDYLVKPFTRLELLSRVKLHVQLARLNRSLEENVQHRTMEIRNLLDHAGQGFMSFGRSLRVDPQYSSECLRIFGKEIQGLPAEQILCPDDPAAQKQLREILSELFDLSGLIRLEMILTLLPEMARIGGRMVRFEYRKMMSEDERIQKLMIILTDVSEKMALEEQVERERMNLRMVVNAVTNRAEVLELFQSFQRFLSQGINEWFEHDGTFYSQLERLVRVIHTYKGLFAQHMWFSTKQNLHKLEDQLLEPNAGVTLNPEMILSLFQSSGIEHAIEQDFSVIRKILGTDYFEQPLTVPVIPERIREIEKRINQLAQGNEWAGLLDDLKRLYFVPIPEWWKPYEEQTGQLASRLDKIIQPFKYDGEMICADALRLMDWNKSLIHLFRNIADHGIESFEDRIVAGKHGAGSITVGMELKNDRVVITVTDDGQGISSNLLKKKCIAAGLLTKEESELIEDEKLMNFIFEQRISTKDTVSELSGRGVGLSAVKEETEKIGGTVHVISTRGQFTRFKFEFPLSKGFFVFAKSSMYAR